ncbi:MAG: hypothetical protein ACLTW9_26695 [Enterocloster sp.]
MARQVYSSIVPDNEKVILWTPIPLCGMEQARRAWLVFLSVGIILTCVVLYDVNVRGNAGNYGGLAQYLTINDDWGTHRWYIWRIGTESHGDCSIKQKIFGSRTG